MGVCRGCKKRFDNLAIHQGRCIDYHALEAQDAEDARQRLAHEDDDTQRSLRRKREEEADALQAKRLRKDALLAGVSSSAHPRLSSEPTTDSAAAPAVEEDVEMDEYSPDLSQLPSPQGQRYESPDQDQRATSSPVRLRRCVAIGIGFNSMHRTFRLQRSHRQRSTAAMRFVGDEYLSHQTSLQRVPSRCPSYAKRPAKTHPVPNRARRTTRPLSSSRRR